MTEAAPPRKRLSVVIATFNEADKIARCLDAVAWADEIIVVDKLSTDRTVEICRSYERVTVVENDDWLYANVSLGLERATGDWILQIDADEIVSPVLAAEIGELLSRTDYPYDGYFVPNRVFFFGKWIRYGVAYDERFARARAGYGFRERLFRKGYAWYRCEHIHEPIATKGKWGTLTGHYDHLSHRTVSEWIRKMNFYTDDDVGRKDVLTPGFVPPRPGRTPVALALIFYRLYVQRHGYKDGVYGFITCALNTFYVLVERCKVWEKHYRLTHPEEIEEY